MNVNLIDTLTEKEREVYDLLLTGATDREIMAELSIARATVRFHIRHIFDKLGVDNRSGAVAYGVSKGWSGGATDKGKAVDGSVLFSSLDLREAAAKLVELGIADRKVVNGLVTDLISALEGNL